VRGRSAGCFGTGGSICLFNSPLAFGTTDGVGAIHIYEDGSDVKEMRLIEEWSMYLR